MEVHTNYSLSLDLLTLIVIIIYPFISLILDKIFNKSSGSLQKNIQQRNIEEKFSQDQNQNKQIDESQLDQEFQIASEQMKKLQNLTNDQLLLFYGYYKQSTIGDCNKGKPRLLDFIETKKWETWNNLKGQSQLSAKQAYISLYKQISQEKQQKNENDVQSEEEDDDIDLDTINEKQKTTNSNVGGLGVSVSRVKEEFIDKTNEQQAQQYLQNTSQQKQDEIKNFFKLIDDGDLDQLEVELQQNYDVTQLNQAGVAPIHYCIDNENIEVLNILLPFYQKNINISDRQGLTPFHYAVLIENDEIIKILLENNANPFLKDNNGEDAYSTASEEIKNIIDTQIKKQ